MTATDDAFNRFRSSGSGSRLPPLDLIRNHDELKLMLPANGLLTLVDGTQRSIKPEYVGINLTKSDVSDPDLWVVRQHDVVHAPENVPWGRALATGRIKHTNLTGGDQAYCGGEMVWRHADNLLIINGRSGRYGPRDKGELESVALAFYESGYNVMYMGWDAESNAPYPFVGTTPIAVKP